MRTSKRIPAEARAMSKYVWSLMARDFRWSRDDLTALGIDVHFPAGRPEKGPLKLQPFEVVVAAVFAQVRPDYHWYVTPNRPDGGIDFIGRGTFLTSEDLGIDAAITIGGQCKKREHINDVVGELSGSFIRMAKNLHPTFLIAALSTLVTPKRLNEAKHYFESTLQRHCHILDRIQIESLIGANLVAVRAVIDAAFAGDDAAIILQYFQHCAPSGPSLKLEAAAPSSALAGELFVVRVKCTRDSLSDRSFRLRWKTSTPDSGASLVSPVGLDSADGVTLPFSLSVAPDPFVVEQDVEFRSYAVGTQQLGSLEVVSQKDDEVLLCSKLPGIEIVENLRPPFYDAPYREPLDELARGLARARAGTVSSIAVVGAGGSGKTRLCEEVCMEARRYGVSVVTAHQAHSFEVPRRILANLLLGLTESSASHESSLARIDDVIGRLEPRLAEQARSSIENLLGRAGAPASFEDDQMLLSVFAVLIAERSRSGPIIVHLQDLHWCTLDVLGTIDRLIWQLGHLKVQITPGGAPTGIRAFFMLEGRRHEHRDDAETGWSTRVFERFIERVGCPITSCRAFSSRESMTFAQRLFEQRHSARRLLSEPLLETQQQLIAAVHKAAGRNPFHMLEQVKFLQQRGVVAQNPWTGFMYLARPDVAEPALPMTVFDTIEARWRYYWLHDRGVAVLLWAIALADDNVPISLFQFLWSTLAPEVTQVKIDSTEFVDLPHSEGQGVQVSFRHENYIHALRKVQLPSSEKSRVIEAYSMWFGNAQQLTPSLLYVRAKVELQALKPNLKLAGRVLRLARAAAVKVHDRSLASRILATLLDNVTWHEHEARPLSARALLRASDDEVALCRSLVDLGQANIADERIRRIISVTELELLSRPAMPKAVATRIWRRRFTLTVLQAELLYHDRRATEAAEITQEAIRRVNALMSDSSEREGIEWALVIMKLYHALGVAVALAGDLKRAVIEARKASDIAEALLASHPDALEVIVTYANILLCEAPDSSERLLLRYEPQARSRSTPHEMRLGLQLNLALSRIVLGSRDDEAEDFNEIDRITAASSALREVFKQAYPAGQLAQAAAAALLLGLTGALQDRGDDIDWFSQAVSLSIRARQNETLWRAYINLAHSLSRSGRSPRDPAAAALDLMIDSMETFADPDQTPRFALLAVPMAHAVRYLILAGDRNIGKVLRRFPALRSMFASITSGVLKADRAGWTSHEWIRIGAEDFVIY